jgi:hypothetical protein
LTSEGSSLSKSRLPLTDNDTQLVGQPTIYVFSGFGFVCARKKPKNILPRFGVLSRALMRAKTIRNWGVDPPVAYRCRAQLFARLVGQPTIYVFFGFGDLFAQEKNPKTYCPGLVFFRAH